MKRYFYFRDVADEASDTDNSSSIMVPVDNITGINPAATTTLYIYHDNAIRKFLHKKILVHFRLLPNYDPY